MSAVDKDMVLATLKTITTGAAAQTLPDGINKWACIVSHDKRSLVLSYKGIEVSLFYHRQLTPVTLQPGDRHPEGVMQDPSEAWQRFDLVGKSAKQKNIVLVNVHQRLEEENKVLQARLNLAIQVRDEYQSKFQRLLDEKEEHEIRYRCIARKRRRK